MLQICFLASEILLLKAGNMTRKTIRKNGKVLKKQRKINLPNSPKNRIRDLPIHVKILMDRLDILKLRSFDLTVMFNLEDSSRSIR